MEHSRVIHINPVRNLQAEVTVPGSKSYTQRALVTASMAHGVSVLHNVLLSEDTHRFIEALQALGVHITVSGGDITIEGTGGVLSPTDKPIYLGNNGTAMRLLTSIACLSRGAVVLTGDDRLCERPIQPLMDYLAQLGVRYRYVSKNGFPPVEILADGLSGGNLKIKNTESSQYISSLLLAAPYAHGPVSIMLEGGIVSRPYIDMTVQVMADFGVQVESAKPESYTIHPGSTYEGRDYIIEGDASSASYFFLAAMLSKGVVRVNNMNSRSRQGDLKILDLFRAWGGEVFPGENWIEVRGHDMVTGDWIIDMGDMPDMVPTAAVLAAFRNGVTEFSRVAHLRIKESNRLAVLVTELGKMGVAAREEEDRLIIAGGKPHGATIHTYNDHRIAMSFAVTGLVVPGVAIENPRCVDKSFPEFWEVFGQLGEAKNG